MPEEVDPRFHFLRFPSQWSLLDCADAWVDVPFIKRVNVSKTGVPSLWSVLKSIWTYKPFGKIVEGQIVWKGHEGIFSILEAFSHLINKHSTAESSAQCHYALYLIDSRLILLLFCSRHFCLTGRPSSPPVSQYTDTMRPFSACTGRKLLQMECSSWSRRRLKIIIWNKNIILRKPETKKGNGWKIITVILLFAWVIHFLIRCVFRNRILS